MQSSRIMLAAAVLFALSAGAVHAQQMPAAPATSPSSPPASTATGHGQPGLPGFDELDKAHRGYLNRADIPKDVEGLKPLRAHFIDYDKDQNGRLTPDEYAAYAATQSGSGNQP